MTLLIGRMETILNAELAENTGASFFSVSEFCLVIGNCHKRCRGYQVLRY